MRRPTDGHGKVSKVDREDSKKKVALNKADQKRAFAARQTSFKALKKRADRLHAFWRKIESLRERMEEDRKLKEQVAKQLAKALKELEKLVGDSQTFVKAETAKGVVGVSPQADKGVLGAGPVNIGSFAVVITALYVYFSKKLKKD